MNKYEAIGVVEVKYFTEALKIIDKMCKQSKVELLNTEKYLGGMLVSIIVAGDISNVKEAIEIAKGYYNNGNEIIKNTIVISRPHGNIMKFIVKNKEVLEDIFINSLDEKSEKIEKPKKSNRKVNKIKG